MYIFFSFGMINYGLKTLVFLLTLYPPKLLAAISGGLNCL
jgi:hypothetical protein